MKIKLQKHFLRVIIPFVTLCFTFAFVISCGPLGTNVNAGSNASPDSIVISSVVPADIFSDGTASSQATLQQAAVFAWKEFIALNWQAKSGFRDSADNSLPFGTITPGIPLVWQTFRHKVEIFPGNNLPPHGYDSTKPDYGYNDNFQPKYFYNQDSTNTKDGQVLPVPGIRASTNTPWINLDETNEIGQANMFAGIVDSTDHQNQMLYLAKANKVEYKYAVKTGWYDSNQTFKNATMSTINYINSNSKTPSPNMGDSLVSMPNGTVEIKTAWRRLTSAEQSSGKFFTDTVRYYVKQNGNIYYKEAVFGMVALHIIQKTPTAPYFIFATFEQTDNILDTTGVPVEDANGVIVNNQNANPTTPVLTVVNATAGSPMQFSPRVAPKVNVGKSLYFQNISDNTLLPQGTIRINKRLNPISPDIIAVNQKAHAAIQAYNQKNNVKNSVWLNYKLISVQFKPINKPVPGKNYTGNDSSTYYQANSVVESDYVLQKFSGRFATLGTISDFKKDSTPAYNAYNGQKNLMGGCMGCHGNATNTGTDYSFIFGFPVPKPDAATNITGLEATRKLVRLFGKEAGNK